MCSKLNGATCSRLFVHELRLPASSLSCSRILHMFSQNSKRSLDLIDSMANNSTNITGDAGVDFPHDLYSRVSKDSEEHRLRFMVQIMEEVVELFEQDHSGASWEKRTEERFLMMVDKQAEDLQACGVRNKRNKKLHMYFKRLTQALERMGHSAEAWELIRQEVKSHLRRADVLGSSLRTN